MIFSKLNKLATREKLFLAAAAFCILALLMDQLVVKSVVKRFKQFDIDIEKAEKHAFYNESVLQKQDEVTKIYNNIRELLGKVTTPAEETDRMNAEIDDLAGKTGVDCISIGPREPRKTKYSYEEYFVEIGKFETDIQGLLRFLDALRTSPGMLRVLKLKVSPDNKGEGSVKGSMLIAKVMMASKEEPAPVEK